MIDATLITSHSEEEGAAGAFKAAMPGDQVQVLGELGDLPVGAFAAVRGERADPRVLWGLEDRGADLIGDLVGDQ